MTINQLQSYFNTMLAAITDDNEVVSRASLLEYVLPLLNAARLTDSEVYTPSYFKSELNNTFLEVDGYMINESGERLQLFITELMTTPDNIMIAQKNYYETLFAKTERFVRNAINRYIQGEQTNDPAATLINCLRDSSFLKQIDIIEIFLITNTISIETRGINPSLKTFEFENKNLSKDNLSSKVIKYQLVDLNRIYDFEISEGNSEPLVVRFPSALKAIRAASEENYESFLAVIPASMLIDIYREHSSRLLERNVRSFLSFKGANKGIRETLRKEPEKFIAFNNGLTITAVSAEKNEEDGVAMISSLTDFQIVNGGQTTASIYFSAKDGISVADVNVVAKINIVKSGDPEVLDDLISKISHYSNSQSRVSSVDLNSRSPHLVRIKQLSESIVTPEGKKWFFERAKGDFQTQLKVNAGKKAQLEKTYPKDKRLTKEQLAKYFVAWGQSPFLVRKGGEKVFRDFMEMIQTDQNQKKIDASKLGRVFYEDLIAKAILFKEFEKIYGSGQNAMGQLRSAAVPYALSVLYTITTDKKVCYFDLGKIWYDQKLSAEFTTFAKELLQLTHKWIVNYSKSDDKSEYAKKEELWSDIIDFKKNRELNDFNEGSSVKWLLKNYKLDKASYQNRYKEPEFVDFTNLINNCRIHEQGKSFYSNLFLKGLEEQSITEGEKLKLEKIIKAIESLDTLEADVVASEEKIRLKLAEELNDENFENKPEASLENTVNFIIDVYQKNLQRAEAAFQAEASKAATKGFKVVEATLTRIGKQLQKGEVPTMKDVYIIADYLGKKSIKIVEQVAS